MVERYVRKIVSTLNEPLTGPEEFEELVREGLLLVCEKHNEIGPGESLRQRLAGWLHNRLQDAWRRNHREHRRNTRAGTATTLDRPTGLSNEYGGDGPIVYTRAEIDLISSRALAALSTQPRGQRITG